MRPNVSTWTSVAEKSGQLMAASLLLAACSLYPETPPIVEASPGNGGTGTNGGSGGNGGGISGAGGIAGGSCTGLTLDLVATGDTFLQSTPQPNTPHGGDMELVISPNMVRRTLVRFTLPGDIQTVQTASLELTVSQNDSFSETVDVHRVTSDWVEDEATWSKASSPTSWNQIGGDFDAQVSAEAIVGSQIDTGSVVKWEVTSDVAAFLDGSRMNHGWLLRVDDPQGSSNNRLRFSSREVAEAAAQPTLRLTYCP